MLHMTVYIENEHGIKQISTETITEKFMVNLEQIKNDNSDGLLHIYIKETAEAEAEAEAEA